MHYHIVVTSEITCKKTVYFLLVHIILIKFFAINNALFDAILLPIVIKFLCNPTLYICGI